MKGAAGRDGAAPAATRAAAARSSARTGGSARRASAYRRRLLRRRRRLTICAGPSSPRPAPRRAPSDRFPGAPQSAFHREGGALKPTPNFPARKSCVKRIFPEALVLHFEHPKPQNSSL
ncbi:unnamed protein product, partial [Bubo scandiacus]